MVLDGSSLVARRAQQGGCFRKLVDYVLSTQRKQRKSRKWEQTINPECLLSGTMTCFLHKAPPPKGSRAFSDSATTGNQVFTPISRWRSLLLQTTTPLPTVPEKCNSSTASCIWSLWLSLLVSSLCLRMRWQACFSAEELGHSEEQGKKLGPMTVEGDKGMLSCWAKSFLRQPHYHILPTRFDWESASTQRVQPLQTNPAVHSQSNS